MPILMGMASLHLPPFSIIFLLLPFFFLVPTASGWKSNCKTGPGGGGGGGYPIPTDMDCYEPVGRIQKCFCDREVPIYKRCVKWTLDELEPSQATASLVYEISVILERVSSWTELEPEVRGYVWQLYDKLLWVDQPIFVESNNAGFGSTQRFLASLDRFLRASRDNVTFLGGSNMAMLRRPKPRCSEMRPLGIADFGSHFGELPSEAQQQPLASIEVPVRAACHDKSSIDNGPSEEEKEAIHFVLYRKAHFFVGNSTHPANARFGRLLSDRHSRCQPGLFANGDQRVLSATVEGKRGGGNGNEGGAMAKMTYRKQAAPLHGEHMVTWWGADDSLDWSTQNGTCKIVHNGDYVEAECPHLTDFTLLVDGMETDPSLCDGFIISLGYALNLGSFLALLILNTIYIIYKSPDLYERVFVQFLGNQLPKMQLDEQALFYNVTLMLFYFSFGVFSDEGHTGGGGIFCRIVAIFNYWLLMACILLTIFQAWRILKMFLWTVALERLIIVATKPQIVLAVSYGLPALLCLIFGLSVDDFFYRNDEFCWIRPSYVWFSVVLPLSLLVLNALLCSIIIGFRLFPRTCGVMLERHASATIRLSKGVRRQGRNKLALLLLMQFSLGMPWILQFATLSIPRLTLTHFLFTLVNGSQGLVLLSLFGYKQIQTWRSTRVKPQQEDPPPGPGENAQVFTNSIGMRIPVAKQSTTTAVQRSEMEGKKEEEEGKH